MQIPGEKMAICSFIDILSPVQEAGFMRRSLPAGELSGETLSKSVYVDYSLSKLLRSFLGKIVTNASRDVSMLIFT